MSWSPPSHVRPMLGSTGQLAGVRRVVLDDGSERGVRAVDVRPAGGIHALVLTDRGMDVGPASCHGWPLHWQSPTGARHPSFHDDHLWLDGFHGGLLVTCGTQNVGPGNEDDGRAFGLHGRISNTPATDVTVTTELKDGVPVAVVVTGRVRETWVYGPDLTLDRTLTFAVGRPELTIVDVVTNNGYDPTVLMLLYHFNIGYPVVSPGSRLEVPSGEVVGFGDAASYVDEYDRFTAPTSGFKALVYEHRVSGDTPQTVRLSNPIFGPTGGIGIGVTYDPIQLPRLWQWRMLGEGMYLIGIEPANCGIRGRATERADDAVDVVLPGEHRRFDLTVTAWTGSSTLSEEC